MDCPPGGSREDVVYREHGEARTLKKASKEGRKEPAGGRMWVVWKGGGKGGHASGRVLATRESFRGGKGKVTGGREG